MQQENPSWRWSIPYEDPDTRSALSVDDPIGDLLYNPKTRKAILDVLDRIEAPQFIRGMIFEERTNPLRQALQILPNPNEAVEVMNADLKEFS